jgi:hypothetical protein
MHYQPAFGTFNPLAKKKIGMEDVILLFRKRTKIAIDLKRTDWPTSDQPTLSTSTLTKTWSENFYMTQFFLSIFNFFNIVVTCADSFGVPASPGIDSKEWIPPAYEAWRAGTITLFLYSVPSPNRLFKNSSSDLGKRNTIHFHLLVRSVQPIRGCVKNNNIYLSLQDIGFSLHILFKKYCACLW